MVEIMVMVMVIVMVIVMLLFLRDNNAWLRLWL